MQFFNITVNFILHMFGFLIAPNTIWSLPFYSACVVSTFLMLFKVLGVDR